MGTTPRHPARLLGALLGGPIALGLGPLPMTAGGGPTEADVRAGRPRP